MRHTDKLFHRLILAAIDVGYTPVLYKTEKKNIIDSRMFPIVGVEQFYMELCLIARWLRENRDIIPYVFPTPEYNFQPVIKDRRKSTENIIKIGKVESYEEALYTACNESVTILLKGV